MGRVMDAIRAIRNLRTQMNVPPSKRAKLFIVTDSADVYAGTNAFFEKMAGASEVSVQTGMDGIDENAVNAVVEGARLYIPLDDLVDREKEIARLNKEKENLLGEIKRVEGKLSNQGFVAKAPAAVVEAEKEKKTKYEDMLAQVEESLSKLQ